jgi:hypothetical protein
MGFSHMYTKSKCRCTPRGETGAFNKKNGFQPATILRRKVYTRMSCEIGKFHAV